MDNLICEEELCEEELCKVEKFKHHNKCVFHCDKIKKDENKRVQQIWIEVQKQLKYHPNMPSNSILPGSITPINLTSTLCISNDCRILDDIAFSIIYNNKTINITIKNTEINGNLSITSNQKNRDSKLIPKVSVKLSHVTKINNFWLSQELDIEEIIIKNTEVNKVKFELNTKIDNISINSKSKIDEFNLTQCKILNKFYIADSKIYNLVIENATFESSVDLCNNLHIDKSNFRNATFEDIVTFNNVTFKNDVKFENTVFEKLVVFKKTKFKQNINLEDVIFKDEVNFLGADIRNVANRETARIIKYSFEKIGNIIESNHYYSLELKKEKENLKFFSKNILRWFEFKLHGWSSNHSTN